MLSGVFCRFVIQMVMKSLEKMSRAMGPGGYFPEEQKATKRLVLGRID